jgi:hypothetical protein
MDAAYFTYETNNLVIDGFVARGDARQLANPNLMATGLYFADYMTRNAVVKNVDVQDESRGIIAPSNVGRQGVADMVTFTIQNSYLRNIVNIAVGGIWSSNGGQGLSSRTVIIQDVQFAHPVAPMAGPLIDNIYFSDTGTGYFDSPASVALVKVIDYNGVSGDNFNLYTNNIHPANATQMPDIFGWVL